MADAIPLLQALACQEALQGCKIKYKLKNKVKE
jgi:hypothetical protein